MKLIQIPVIFLFFLTNSVFAQDLITKKNLEIIEAKVLEINPKEIKFKKFNNLEGPTITILIEELKSIKYENGTSELFDKTEQSNKVYTGILSGENLYLKGKNDAINHYNAKGSGKGGVLAGSILSPLIALIPAIATSATFPKDFNLDFPDRTLMSNPEYSKGYNYRAKKIKQKAIWGNWAAGLGLNLVYQVVRANIK